MTIKLHSGLVLEKLTILEEMPYKRHGDRVWRALCECGAVFEDTACHMRTRTSCGAPKCRKTRKDSNGGYACADKSKRIPEYGIWCDIKRRCSNKTSEQFKDYGGRGIFVCDRWKTSFPAFFEDMGHRPSASHQIERVDNDGPYSPENCKWATRREQGANKRNNVVMTYAGRSMILADWARETGLPEKMLQNRKQNGWSDERTLTEVPKKDRRRKKVRVILPNGYVGSI